MIMCVEVDGSLAKIVRESGGYLISAAKNVPAQLQFPMTIVFMVYNIWTKGQVKAVNEFHKDACSCLQSALWPTL